MSTPIHKMGQHWQAGVQNAAGAGIVKHTDYIHPVYGYSRFDGHVSPGLCEHHAKQAHERRRARMQLEGHRP
jgi:hypothetical protein